MIIAAIYNKNTVTEVQNERSKNQEGVGRADPTLHLMLKGWLTSSW